MSAQSAKAKELWIEVVCLDPMGPGVLEWAEVSVEQRYSHTCCVYNIGSIAVPAMILYTWAKPNERNQVLLIAL